MIEQGAGNREEIETPSVIDDAQIGFAMQSLRDDENFLLAIAAGLVAAVIGAAAWTGITIATNYQIGFMAVGVGYLVAFSIRTAGKGISKKFQILGALLSLLGCVSGNYFTICHLIAQKDGIGFFDQLTNANPLAILFVMKENFSPMDILFYGIAIYEGYRLSLRKFNPGELESFIDPDSAGGAA